MVNNHEQNRPELVAERLRGNINFEADDDFFFRGKPSTSTNLIRNIVAAVAVLGTMVGGFYIYHQQVDQARPTSVAVIKADEGPIKITPSDPGGMKVPHLEMSVYDNISTDKKPNEKTAEQILPSPEKPIDLEAVAKAMAQKKSAELASVNIPPQDTISNDNPNTLISKDDNPDNMLKESIPDSDKAEKTSHSVTVEEKRQDAGTKDTLAAEKKSPVVAKVVAETKAATEAAKTAPKVVFIGDSNQPDELKLPKDSKDDANNGENKVIKLSNNNKPQAKGYYIQLAAFRSAGTAKQNWQNISSKHTDLLGRFSPVISAKNMPDGSTFYRLQAGPVVSMAEARKLCTQLGKRNQNCFVTKQD